MLPDSSRLRGCKPGLWISAEKKHPATEELPNVDQFNPIKEAEITAQSSRNLQKKIIPWELASDLGTSDLPIRDLVGTERRQTYTDGRRESSLVLVASLIDKAPNLGGVQWQNIGVLLILYKIATPLQDCVGLVRCLLWTR